MDRLRAMEVFVRTVEAGSLSGAAAQLGLANASVTTLLSNLEMHLGVMLLRRSTRHVQVTEDGESYYVHCRAILAAVEEAETGLGGGNLRGMLRLEAPIAFGHLVIAPAMARFARAHPELRVVVSLTNAVDSLIRRGVDVAIRYDAVDTGDLVARSIYHGHHVLCGAPAFLEANGTPTEPAALNPRHCLGFAEQAGLPRPWRFRREGKVVELLPEGNLFFNSSDALMRAAMDGAGMVYVLDALAEPYLTSGALVRLLEDWQTDEQRFYAVYPKARFTPPKVHALIAFLAGLFPTVPGPSAPVPVRRHA